MGACGRNTSKAPTSPLQGVFDRINARMLEIYDGVARTLNIELNQDITDVFDRLLASPEDIKLEREIKSGITFGQSMLEEIKLRER